jgi:hypothetical protein
MKWKWRREAILDVYNLVLAVGLFATPWFLVRATATTEIDLWAAARRLARSR